MGWDGDPLLAADWLLDPPAQDELDDLVLGDLIGGPHGRLASLIDRVEGLLERCERQHPVPRAVAASRARLGECAARAARLFHHPA